MATYNLSQLINKNLYSKGRLNARSNSTTNSRLLYTFEPNTYVGVIYSVVNEEDGPWFMVDRNVGGKTVTFFVKASAAGINVANLKEQGAMTVKEEVEAAAQANMSTGDKILNTAKKVGGYAVVAFFTYKAIQHFSK